jgi:Na+-translocating ferredoxin:NAD+ oxidoreductase RnfD subunit
MSVAVAPSPASVEAPNAPKFIQSLLWFFSFRNRYLPPMLITSILVVGHWTFGILEGYTPTLLAIGASIATEIVLSLLFRRRLPHLASAYISGISVGILIRSPYLWPYALCAMISITSKYAIRWRGRHLWNPSNFGVSAMFILAPATVASLSIQWSNSIWAMMVIWCLGSIIIWRLKRFHITATYVTSFLVFSAIRTAITGNSWLAEVAPITGPMYQLFIFFMITDPPTTVRTKRGQCLVAFLVAFVEMIIRLVGDVHAPYYALFLVGPVANTIEIYRDSRKRPGSEATVSPALPMASVAS